MKSQRSPNIAPDTDLKTARNANFKSQHAISKMTNLGGKGGGKDGGKGGGRGMQNILQNLALLQMGGPPLNARQIL